MQLTSEERNRLVSRHISRDVLIIFLTCFVSLVVLSMVQSPKNSVPESFFDSLAFGFIGATLLSAVYVLNIVLLGFRRLFDPDFDNPYFAHSSQYVKVALPYSNTFDR